MSDIFPHDEQPCPHCGERLSQAAGETVPPKDQDLSICAYCYGINRFVKQEDGRMLLRAVTDDEFIELPLEERRLIKQTQSLVRQINENLGREE